jgi:hypothetical protein
MKYATINSNIMASIQATSLLKKLSLTEASNPLPAGAPEIAEVFCSGVMAGS